MNRCERCLCFPLPAAERSVKGSQTSQHAAGIAGHFPDLGPDSPVVPAGVLLHGKQHRRHRHAVSNFDAAAPKSRTGRQFAR